MDETEWDRGVDYHGKQKEALDFAIKYIEGLKVAGEEIPSSHVDDDWYDTDDALEQIKEILK